MSVIIFILLLLVFVITTQFPTPWWWWGENEFVCNRKFQLSLLGFYFYVKTPMIWKLNINLWDFWDHTESSHYHFSISRTQLADKSFRFWFFFLVLKWYIWKKSQLIRSWNFRLSIYSNHGLLRINRTYVTACQSRYFCVFIQITKRCKLWLNNWSLNR